eukprot:4014256-Amphidinium_carterae.1
MEQRCLGKRCALAADNGNPKPQRWLRQNGYKCVEWGVPVCFAKTCTRQRQSTHHSCEGLKG